MKRIITVLCLLVATAAVNGTSECQAQPRGRKMRARTGQSARRAMPTRVSRKPAMARPVSRGTARPRPSTRPRPFPKPGVGNNAPMPRPTRPGNAVGRPRPFPKPSPGVTRPRPFPKPGNGGVTKPRPRPTRPGTGGVIKPRPRPLPGGGIKPLPKPLPKPGGVIKPRPRPFPKPGIKPLPRPFPKPRPNPGNGGIRPRPRPLDPVLGGGRPRPRPNRPWFRPGRRNRFANHWCFQRPTYCHWWFDYCTPLAYCDTTDIITCDFVQCGIPEVILPGGEIINDAVWYLGLKGMVLPESGLGIDEVDPDSPAARAGLEAGMIIISCNDIQITEEADMIQAIETSGGILTMIVQLEDGSQGEAVVEMERVPQITL